MGARRSTIALQREEGDDPTSPFVSSETVQGTTLPFVSSEMARTLPFGSSEVENRLRAACLDFSTKC
jgi:hypothetical protein